MAKLLNLFSPHNDAQVTISAIFSAYFRVLVVSSSLYGDANLNDIDTAILQAVFYLLRFKWYKFSSTTQRDRAAQISRVLTATLFFWIRIHWRFIYHGCGISVRV